MKSITRRDITDLAQDPGSACVSIYIPTHQKGKEVLQRQDRILLKNEVSKVEKGLVGRGFSGREADQILNPIKEKLDDVDFWHYQNKGLAIFLSKEFTKIYNLPIDVKPRHYVSSDFYLIPLLPLAGREDKFFVLGLSLGEVKLFEGNGQEIEEIYVKDLVPQQLEEVVGFDYREKFLGVHSGSGKQARGTFHGHGHWQSDQKDEILAFFRAVNKGVNSKIHDPKDPLILVCVDYLFPIYKKANTYKNLFEDHVSITPGQLNSTEIHNRAWELIGGHFDKEKNDKKELFRQFHDTERTSVDLNEIIPAAMSGKVDTLFLDRDAQVWGIYDPGAGKVNIQENHRVSNTSLTNLAAVLVFKNGGNVFLQDRSDLPADFADVNALYRY